MSVVEQKNYMLNKEILSLSLSLSLSTAARVLTFSSILLFLTFSNMFLFISKLLCFFQSEM